MYFVISVITVTVAVQHKKASTSVVLQAQHNIYLPFNYLCATAKYAQKVSYFILNTCADIPC